VSESTSQAHRATFVRHPHDARWPSQRRRATMTPYVLFAR
jgi:hypothetical protein